MEIVEQSTKLTTRQWKQYAQETKATWTEYTKISKAKWNNHIAMKYRLRLKDLVADYHKDVVDTLTLSGDQLKLN